MQPSYNEENKAREKIRAKVSMNQIFVTLFFSPSYVVFLDELDDVSLIFHGVILYRSRINNGS